MSPKLHHKCTFDEQQLVTSNLRAVQNRKRTTAQQKSTGGKGSRIHGSTQVPTRSGQGAVVTRGASGRLVRQSCKQAVKCSNKPMHSNASRLGRNVARARSVIAAIVLQDTCHTRSRTLALAKGFLTLPSRDCGTLQCGVERILTTGQHKYGDGGHERRR